MTTSLYGIDIGSLAKPVKTGRKKAKETPTPAPSPVPAPVVKEKKPPTEKQLAARAKLAESRKLKLAEAAAAKLQLETEIKKKEDEISAKELEKQEKKRIAAENRKAKKAADAAAAVVAPTPPPSQEDSISEAVDEALAGKNARKRKAADPDEPPRWVHKFVESVILEKSKLSEEKKPIKQVKEEAKLAAQEQWKDGFTRDRVNHEVDNHMNRLYGMIFTRK